MAEAALVLEVAVDARETMQRLGRAVLRAGYLRPYFEVLGKSFVTSTHRRFETHRGPDGAPWKALAPATIAKRQEKLATRSKRGIASSAMAALSGKTGNEPLFVSGRLMGSVNYKADSAALALGSNAKFPGGEKSAAAIHQLGGHAGRGDKVEIPARPFFGIDAGDVREMGRLADLYFGAI